MIDGPHGGRDRARRDPRVRADDAVRRLAVAEAARAAGYTVRPSSRWTRRPRRRRTTSISPTSTTGSAGSCTKGDLGRVRNAMVPADRRGGTSPSSTPTTSSARTGSPRGSARAGRGGGARRAADRASRGQRHLRRQRVDAAERRPGLAAVHAAHLVRPQLLRLAVPVARGRPTWRSRTSTATSPTACRTRTGSSRSRRCRVAGSTSSCTDTIIFKRRRDFSLGGREQRPQVDRPVAARDGDRPGPRPRRSVA